MPGWDRWDRWARSGQWGDGGGGLIWLLYDEFTTPDSAPITSPRTCEPGPGTLTITDTGNKASIASGEMLYTGLTGIGDPHYTGTWSQAARLAGLAGHVKFKKTATGGRFYFALHTTYADSPTSCSFASADATLYARDNASLVNVKTISNNIYYDFLLINRSVGNFFIIDGMLYWVGDADSANQDNIMFNAGSANAGVEHTDNFGALSLPANGYSEWDADFSTVTASISGGGSQVDNQLATGDYHIHYSFTYADPDGVNVYSDRNALATNYINIIDIGGALYIQKRAAGGAVTNLFIAGGFWNDGAYDVDVIRSGNSLRVVINGVDVLGAGDVTGVTREPGIRIDSDGAISTDMKAHPNPALGIATDRVIAPQTTDTFTHTADFLAYIRNVTLPAAGSTEYFFRITGSDEITLQLVSDGSLVLLDNATSRITAVGGTISDGDDVALICEGADAEIFVAGTSAGSSAAIAVTTGTAGKRLDAQTGIADSIELFPRDVSGLLPRALV